MKKFIFVLCFLISLSVFNVSYAEEEAFSYEVTGVSQMLEDSENWTDAEKLAKISKDSFERTVGATNAVTTYTGKEYLNTIFDFDINFGEMKGGKKWNTIVVRSKNANMPNIWTSNTQSYCFIVRPMSVELQKYCAGVSILGIFPTDIKDNETVNIKAGAVNTPNGVQLLFYVNGNLVVNYYDSSSSAIKEPGYFALNNYGVMKMTPSKNVVDKLDSVPIEFEISEYKRTTEKLFLDYKKTGEEEPEITWYTLDNKPSDNAFEPTIIKDEAKLIENSLNKRELEMNDNFVGKYIIAEAKISNGVSCYTKPVYIDPLEYMLSKNVYMLCDYEKAVINGEIKQIDEADWQVTPFFENDTTYVPLRFCIESIGGTVSWNEGDRSVKINRDDLDAVIYTDSADATLSGATTALTAKPQILYGRTFISSSDLAKLLGINCEVYENGAIALGENEISLSEEEYGYVKKIITE